jgi:hypothetical protein
VPNEQRQGEVQREVTVILDILEKLMRMPAFSCCLVQLLSGGSANRAEGDADHGTR